MHENTHNLTHERSKHSNLNAPSLGPVQLGKHSACFPGPAMGTDCHIWAEGHYLPEWGAQMQQQGAVGEMGAWGSFQLLLIWEHRVLRGYLWLCLVYTNAISQDLTTTPEDACGASGWLRRTVSLDPFPGSLDLVGRRLTHTGLNPVVTAAELGSEGRLTGP